MATTNPGLHDSRENGGETKMKMVRREFLAKVGLGSLVLTSLSEFVTRAPSALAQTGEVFYYHLATHSFSGPTPGTPAAPQDRLMFYGQGTLSRSGVTGGGAWNHVKFPGSNPPKGGAALPIVAAGAWQAKQYISFGEIGRFGVLVAGIAEMVVDLLRTMPSPATIRGARLRLICNIGFAGLDTGQPEGIALSIPGTPFFTGETPGPFVPVVPMLGLTAFSKVALQ